MFGAALLSLALATGLSSCSKDDDDASTGCCTMSQSAMGVSISSKVCSDGTYTINGEDVSDEFDEFDEFENWSLYKKSLEENGYTCD